MLGPIPGIYHMNHPRRERFYRVILAMAVLAVSCHSLFAATIDFNTYTSTNDNDLANNFVSSRFQQVTDHGITGGAVASLGGSATYRTAQSQPSTLSIAFRYEQTPSLGSGSTARLGWVGDLDPVDFFTPSLYFWGEFANDGQFYVRNAPNGQGGTGSLFGLGSISQPTFGNWLQMSFSATPLGNANYYLAMTLQDLGPDGLQSPNLLFSNGTGVLNALAAADNTIYPGFFGYYHTQYYDNFSVDPVPEPSSLVLVVVGSILFTITMRMMAEKRFAASPGRSFVATATPP